MSVSMRWVRWGAVVLALLLAAGFAVGSLFDGSSSSLRSADGDQFPSGEAGFDAPGRPLGGVAEAPEEFAKTQAVTADDAAFAPDIEPGGSVFGDRIIKSTSLSIRVEDGRFEQAWNAAVRIANEAGGEVVGSNRGRGEFPIYEDQRSEPAPYGTLTLRVPSASLDEVTSRLRNALGEVTNEQTSSQDVSQEFVDLQSRLRNLRGEEGALLALYRRAKNVRDTLEVRERLSSVRGEIEQVTGRIRYIESRTEFSTISLTLAEPGAAIVPPNDDPSFGKAWDTALEGLVRIASAGMILGVWLAPFALLAAAVFGLRRRTQPPAPQA